MHYNTVNNLLKDNLLQLMQTEVFKDFRLVGGTALSLQIGHRLSIDLDFFTDIDYGTIDFEKIDKYLEETFPYTNHLRIPVATGKSYHIGTDKDNYVKLDVFYADPFIQPIVEVDTIRMASIEEIIAMKIEVVQNLGRKKDFWDLHELLFTHNYSIAQMLELHEKRYPWTHDRTLIIKNFTDFNQADEDFDPICLKQKDWDLIKTDITNAVKSL